MSIAARIKNTQWCQILVISITNHVLVIYFQACKCAEILLVMEVKSDPDEFFMFESSTCLNINWSIFKVFD